MRPEERLEFAGFFAGLAESDAEIESELGIVSVFE
jgi:hypothetical protein